MTADPYERKARLQKVKLCLQRFDPVGTAIKNAPSEGYTFREISEIMGLRYNEVDVAYRSAIRKLKREAERTLKDEML